MEVDVHPVARILALGVDLHLQHVGLSGVGGFLGQEVVRQGDRLPGLHQRRGFQALCLRHQVGRADLIVFAPAAPVRQLVHPLIELRDRHGLAVLRLGERVRLARGDTDGQDACQCESHTCVRHRSTCGAAERTRRWRRVFSADRRAHRCRTSRQRTAIRPGT